jgi:hypothetical protein
MEEHALATQQASIGPQPPPNTKAHRARLYREKRKHELSDEQLEEARRKNRCLPTGVCGFFFSYLEGK